MAYATAQTDTIKGVITESDSTNLTDQVYVVARRPAGLRPGIPRAFRIGLKADF